MFVAPAGPATTATPPNPRAPASATPSKNLRISILPFLFWPPDRVGVRLLHRRRLVLRLRLLQSGCLAVGGSPSIKRSHVRTLLVEIDVSNVVLDRTLRVNEDH